VSSTAESLRPLRIVGCGSAHGDDAVGWEVVRVLRASAQSLADVELYTVDSGHQILDLLDGRGTLIVVDAVSSGRRPGTLHHLHWPDAGAETMHPGSTHALRPAWALRLAGALGILPPQVVIFGVEMTPSGTQGTGLSGPVAAALPRLTQRISDDWLRDRGDEPAGSRSRRSGSRVTRGSRLRRQRP
jgi:hydrogenase maturation protease